MGVHFFSPYTSSQGDHLRQCWLPETDRDFGSENFDRRVNNNKRRGKNRWNGSEGSCAAVEGQTAGSPAASQKQIEALAITSFTPSAENAVAKQKSHQPDSSGGGFLAYGSS